MNIINVVEIYKSFGEVQVLKNISLSIPKGSSTVILGSSGSGKSVLLKCMAGLLDIDSGSIYNDFGYNVEDFPMKIGFLFQGAALFDSLTVYENIVFGVSQLEGKNIDSDKMRSLAIEKISLVGMDKYVLDLYPSELSGGMQKRVALARAICRDPDILFLDEPTTGLDPLMSNVINLLINKIRHELDMTVVTITHDINSAKTIADKLIFIYNGSVMVERENPNFEHSDNKYLDQFLKGSLHGPINYIV